MSEGSPASDVQDISARALVRELSGFIHMMAKQHNIYRIKNLVHNFMKSLPAM